LASASVPVGESSVRRTPEEARQQAIADWRAIRAELGRGTSMEARDTPAATPPRSLSRQSETERQINSLRRELGRDDLGL
jgi:hypothetical protein